MTEAKHIQKDFNEVSNLTATCTFNCAWPRDTYPELEIGKTYKVTHIGVYRSSTEIILEEFGHKEFMAICFDLYEDGEPLGRDYVKDFRFLAPYLKERIRLVNPYQYEERLKGVSICAHLREIEKKHDVKVMLAVQSGSRAKGLEAANSDWDVRYLYIHKPEWYEQPGEHRFVIEHVFDDGVDTYGWELRDALSSLMMGNPTILEWLDTPSPYIVKAPIYKRLREIGKVYFNPNEAVRFCNRVYCQLNERFLQKDGTMKEFLYYLRGVLACKWIEQEGSLPPSNFSTLLNKTVEEEEIRSKVNRLVEIKKNGGSIDNIVVDADLVDYARQLAKHFETFVGSSDKDLAHKSTDEIDSLFQEIVRQSR